MLPRYGPHCYCPLRIVPSAFHVLVQVTRPAHPEGQPVLTISTNNPHAGGATPHAELQPLLPHTPCSPLHSSACPNPTGAPRDIPPAYCGLCSLPRLRLHILWLRSMCLPGPSGTVTQNHNTEHSTTTAKVLRLDQIRVTSYFLCPHYKVNQNEF